MSDTSARRSEAAVPVSRLIGWGVSGQIVFVLSQFALVVALSRFATIKDVGHFGLASAISMPIYFMLGFGFRVNQATDLESRYSFRDFMSLRTICTTISYLLITVIGFVFLDPEARWALLAFAASRGADTTSTVTYGLFQKYDRMDRVAYSLFIRGIGGAAVFTVVLALTKSPIAGYLALFAVWAAIAVLVDLRFAYKLIKGTPDDYAAKARNISDILITSWPIAINGLLSSLQNNIPRYFITGILGIVALGQFTVIAYAMQAINTVTNSLAQSILSRLAFYLQNGHVRKYLSFLNVLSLSLLAPAVAASAIALEFGDQIVRFIFGDEFSNLGLALALSMVLSGIISMVNVLQSALSASRNFMAVMWTRLPSVLFVAGASYVGALHAGLEGVIIGMAIASGLQACFLYCMVRIEAHKRAGEPTT